MAPWFNIFNIFKLMILYSIIIIGCEGIHPKVITTPLKILFQLIEMPRKVAELASVIFTLTKSPVLKFALGNTTTLF